MNQRLTVANSFDYNGNAVDKNSDSNYDNNDDNW